MQNIYFVEFKETKYSNINMINIHVLYCQRNEFRINIIQKIASIQINSVSIQISC